jgi:hypothetical protein
MAGTGSDILRRVRGRVQAAVARNAALLNVTGRGMSAEARAKHFYDIPAKKEVAERIADEEVARAAGHHNDVGDAERHARWSKRTSEATGPIFAEVAGIAHELDNLRQSFGAHGVPPYELMPTQEQTWDEGFAPR